MRRSAAFVGVAIFSALHVLVLAGPATVLAMTADKGGLTSLHGFDLVGISLVIGAAHAYIVEHRLVPELREVDVRLDAFLAAFNALVVLALVTTGLLVGLLGGFARQHAAMLNDGWPVVGLWTLVLLGAVAAAELVRSLVLRWLEPRHEGHFS